MTAGAVTRRLLALFSAAGSCLLMPVGLRAAPVVRLATHVQAPYGDFGPDQKFDGIAVRVVRCVLEKMGYEAQIDVLPWTRAQMVAENGERDGFFPATMNPQREVWAQATAVVADQDWVWYLNRQSALDPSTVEFRTQARVGAHLGSARLEYLEKNHYNVVLRSLTDDSLLYAFVTAARADAVLVGNLSALEVFKNRKLDASKYRVVLEQRKPLHAWISRRFTERNPDFVLKFNEQLPGCRRP